MGYYGNVICESHCNHEKKLTVNTKKKMMKKRQYTTHTHTHTTTKTKEAINREGTEKNYNNSQKTINIKAISTFLPITALTVKGLNFTIKRMAEWRKQ